MDDLDVHNLVPLMPLAVREEFLAHGDASVFGFSPGVKHWLTNSEHPRVSKWRDDLKRETARQVKVALVEQEKMAEVAKAAYANSKGSIRHISLIHPVIKKWMQTTEGSDVFTNRESIADTKRNAPKLFFNN